MACVNVNDKGFKAISKRLNIDPKILEGIIDGYWVANPNLELSQEFPSDQYILEYLRLGGVSSTQFSSLLEYENAHTLWKQKYSNIKNFDNSNDARNYHYLVERLFGKANVGVIPRLNKTIDVVVLEPQKKIISESIITKPATPAESIKTKESVSELFDSNPELANAVYEALGFNNGIEAATMPFSPDNPEAIVYGIGLNGDLIGEILVDDEGRISSSIGQAGVELYEEYRGKGYGVQSYLAVARELAKQNKTLKSEAFGKDNINEAASKVWKSLIKQGYAVDKGDYYEITNLFTLQQKQQAQQLYSNYLDTIFPDSKVKDIVTHFSKNEFEVFDKSRQITGTLGKAFYFYPYISSKEEIEYEKKHENNVRFSLLNINKLGVATDTKAITLQHLLDNNDGVQLNNTEIVVFEPEQIHILGSKQDIEGFKNFVQERSLPTSSETINIYAGTKENVELSNFAIRPFESELMNNEAFNTVEGAFQASKLSYTDGHYFTEEGILTKEGLIIWDSLKTATGVKAKTIGKNIKNLNVKKWDQESHSVMKYLLRESFAQNPKALQILLGTGDATLTHTQDKSKWGTEFPKLLMEVRDELRPQEESLAGDIVNALNQQISSTEDTLSDREKRIIADRDAFLNSRIISPTERGYLAKLTVSMFSTILDQLLGLNDNAEYNAESFKELYFPGKYEDSDFRTMSRGAIIKKIGPMTIFNVIKEQFFNPYKRDELSDEAFDILELCYLNFETLLDCGYHKLITNERIPLVGNYNGEVNDLDNIDDNNESEDPEIPKTTTEKYNTRARSVSVKDSLSPLIRRALDRIQEKDDTGQVVLDQYGLPKLIDTDTVYNTILSSVRKATTIELMESILENTATINPWIKGVLDLIKKEPFRSQFYLNFRKDFTLYSIVKRELDKDGNYIFKTHIINTNDLSKSIISDVRNLLVGDELPIVYNVDHLSGYGVVNMDIVKASKARLETVMNEFKVTNKQFSVQDLQTLSNTYFTEVSNILQVIGISLNDVVIKNILAGSTSKAKLFSRESSVGFKVLNAVDSILSAIENTENPERYALLGEDKNSVKGFYGDIAKTISAYTELSVESSTYENGKLYYSYTTPSYLGKLILNLKNSMNNIDEFNEFISENYTKYGWFVHDTLLKDGSIKKEHYNEWLRLLSENTQNGAKMRNMLEHKVELHYNGVPYTDLSALDYSVALIQEFFSDFSSKPTYAWYHVPILADKPSAEYIKFRRYTNNNNTSVDGYEKEIVRQLVKVAKQELRRIKTVKERATLDVEKITSFDKRGSEFQFLDFLNDIFLKGDNRESALVQEYLNDNIENTAELTKLLEKHIQTGMENKFRAALATWEKIGVLDTHKNPKTDKMVYTYLNNVATNKEEAEEALKNYFYNSFFATTEIIQLTVTDIAYYKDTEDFQKRFAQIHSPALRFNTSAVDSKGERYTKDGKERTMYLADELLTSELVPMVEKIFEDKIKSAKNAAQKKGYTALKDNIIKAFTHSENSDGINVTDAQAYTTLKGYRKKMGQAGKWTEAMQAAYERINSGNMNIQDLEIVCQPMKPFVYTQIAKQSYSKVMKFLKVPVQNKNSEYVLIMAGAIAASQGGKVNRLKAISEFMDANDIDTMQFGTAVKSGQMGVIDINKATSEEEIKALLEAHTFAIDPTTSLVKTEAGQKVYNELYVHEIPFEDYGIQQEVPEHLVDAHQLFGSQIRKLILADITPGTTFQVGQDKESMTKEQLIDQYQELIAANVEESFNELVKDLQLDNADIKVKNKAISKLLVEEIKTNSRYGPALLTACSLNEQGDFVIPLSDPSQSYRIQQLMNSIIKSRITKQKIKGGAVVLVSPYGLSNDLKIIFNEDGSIKYFECYLPAYTKEFFKDFLDENGQLNIEELPDELRKLIGYRIPTEDKYSMAPLYIKGFLEPASGSAIMLPKEITLLSGSDYDIDKMYVMLPEFKVSRHFNANKFKKAFKLTLQTKVSYDDLDIAYNLVVIREGVDGISKDTLEDKMNKFYQENKRKFTEVEYEKVKYNPKQSAISQSVEARNNRIIDLMYSILTNKDTADKIFNPGSFDVLKKTSRIIVILKNSKQYTYNDLKDLSLDELKDIVKKHGFINTRSILDPTTQVAFHQQNTTAGKLIGVFANHNSSHAIMQLQDARFNMQKEIVFDGVSFKDIRSSVSDVLGAKLDNVYALDGFTYISKNNAGYLAASVDAVKDPVLNHMNLNTYTANVAMVLSRMGYDSDSIGLLLTLPAIERVTQLYFKLSNEGYISSDNPVNAEIAAITEKLGGLISEEAISENLAMSNFTKAELAKHLNAEETSEELLYQLETLVLFKELLKMGSSLNELTFLTKYDTVSNAVGPTIADSLAKLLRVSKFLKGADKEKAPFTPGTYAVFEKSPMLNAFYVYSNQASRLIFEDNFPHFLADFVKALEILRDSTKSDINVLTVNKFINDFIAFKLTKEIPDGTVFKSSRADRQRFLLTDYKDDNEKTRQGFIGWFTLQVADNPALALNPLIRVLTVKEKSKHNPIRSLVANVAGLSSDAIETVKNGWSDLLRNPETKELALALFNYNFYKSGFSFSPTSFMHLVPNDVKIAATAYIDSLRPNTTNSIFEIDTHKAEAFVNLFKRNNGHDKRLVPTVDSTKIKYNLLDSEEETLIAFSTEANAELDKIIVSDYDSRVYSDVITITQLDKNKNVVESMYMNVSEGKGAPIYLKISPLGIKNGALEYSYETSHVDYSVIPDNLKPKLVTGNPDNISGMDVQTMEKVYKEYSGIIEKITATVSNMSTEDIQKILGNTHHQLSKVIKVLRKIYPEFEKSFNSATKSKLIKYLTNALLKDASGVKIC